MMNEVIKRKKTTRQGWYGVVGIIVGSFGLGYVFGNMVSRMDYRKEVATIQSAYKTSLESKDRMIKRLGSSNVMAARAAREAALSVKATAKTVEKNANENADRRRRQDHAKEN